MPRLAILSFVALSACASGASTTSTRPETTRIVGGNGTSSTSLNLNASTSASVSQVAFAVDKVWRLLPVAYDSLKIPLTVVDPPKHTMGNDGMKIRQKLGSAPLSRYIDCGQAQIGPSADTYDVYLTVTTSLRAMTPAETEIATTVEASAKSGAFAQGYSRCTSKGTIETAIAAILTAKLATK